MTADVVIEYPCRGATYDRDEYGVYEYDTYPPGSVLEGQQRRRFRGSYETLGEAQAAHPEAAWSDTSGFAEVSDPHTPPAWFDPTAVGEVWDD